MTTDQPDSEKAEKQSPKFLSRNTAAAIADAAKLRAKQAALLTQLKKLESIDQPALLGRIGESIRASSIEFPQKTELVSKIVRLEENVASSKQQKGVDGVIAKIDAASKSGQLSHAYQRLGESAIAALQADVVEGDLGTSISEYHVLMAKAETLRVQIQHLSKGRA